MYRSLTKLVWSAMDKSQLWESMYPEKIEVLYEVLFHAQSGLAIPV